MIRAAISCSSLHRRKLCPGSAAAEAACPEVHTADSDMGTRLHGIMALLRDPDRWRGIADADRLVCERADSLRDESLAALEAEHGLVGTEYVESFEVEIFIEVGGNRIPGHIDYLRWYPEARILVIFDYKFGTNPVERAEANLQLRGYAVGAYQIHPGAGEVYTGIIQPRLPRSEQIHLAVYRPDEIAQSYIEIRSLYRAASAPNAPRVASLAACRDCRAKAGCDQGHDLVVSAREELASVENFDALPVDVKAEYYDRAKLVASFCKAIIDRVEAAVKAEPLNYASHFTLKPNPGDREIIDPAKAFALCQQRIGADFNRAFIALCEVPVTKLEKAVLAADPEMQEGTQRERSERFNSVFASLIERRPKSPSVKRVISTPSLAN